MNGVPSGIGEVVTFVGFLIVAAGVISALIAFPGKRYNERQLTIVLTGLAVALLGGLALGASYAWLVAGLGAVAAVGWVHQSLKRRDERLHPPAVIAQMERDIEIEREVTAFKAEIERLSAGTGPR